MKYLPWADFVRVFALVCVVVLHVAAIYVVGWSNYPLSWWMTGNIFDSFARVAVPLFVMVSGALLLPKSEPMSSFYSKRVIRVVVPWVFWASMVLGYHLWASGTAELVRRPLAILFHAYVTSYWYVVLLLMVYVVTPWLRAVVQKRSLKELVLLVIGLCLSSSLLSLWIELSNHPRLVQLAWLLAFLGYFMGGYAVRRWYENKPDLKVQKKTLVIYIVSWLSTAVGTWLLSSYHHRLMQLFYDYGFMTVIVQSFAGFTLLIMWSKLIKKTFFKNATHQQWLQSLSQSCYGIFLIQPLIIGAMVKSSLGVWVLHLAHPILVIPLFSLLVLASCYGVVRILVKLPVLRLVV